MSTLQTSHRLEQTKARLQSRYEERVLPVLKERLGFQNVQALPRVKKVVINVGAGEGSRDPKHLEQVAETLRRITGQQPVMTKARKSISNFKIRKGMSIGAMVTLRGRRMYEFLDKLINVTLPRVRDFQGLSLSAFDRQGNYTVAFREHTVFPEMSGDSLERLHGVQVTICTNAPSPEKAAVLLRELGVPFQEKT